MTDSVLSTEARVLKSKKKKTLGDGWSWMDGGMKEADEGVL